MRVTCRPESAASRSRRFHSAGEAGGAPQRHLRRTGRGHPPGQVAGRHVDGVRRHDPVGRVLAAGHRDQAGHGLGDGVLAGQLGGGVGLAFEQRPQAGVDALDVVVGQRGPQHPVDLPEQVVDVAAAGGGMGEVEVPVGVGRADDPVRAPGDHEQHRASPSAGSARCRRACRSRGTTRWTPLEARTRMRPRPARPCTSSVQVAVALTTWRAATCSAPPALDADAPARRPPGRPPARSRRPGREVTTTAP